MWHDFVVVSRVTAEPTGLRFREWSLPPDALLLVRRGSDPRAPRLPRSQQDCHERELAHLRRLLERARLRRRRLPGSTGA
jgi:hypothetical protein